MAEQREAAPSGIAGLVRYEQEKSLINIKPDYIFAGVAAIAEIELLIQGLFFIAAAFGVLFGLMFYWMYKGRIEKTRGVKIQSFANAPAQISQTQQPVQQNAAQQ
ncbi:MAG: hypothetical protein KKB25_00140 [Nanoarchaeota archaeon]|nr:hypothetical protein [Nanoarchaeota archaeon]